VELPEGSTVADAIRRSELAREFPEVDFDQLQAGIWGTPVERGRTLLDGDRVELYRPLVMDPREARRLKAGG
jgi:putative ubiquitin-RnfH superfamily antitoxin RatB of RatAB toxin-antitoxin module